MRPDPTDVFDAEDAEKALRQAQRVIQHVVEVLEEAGETSM